MCSKAVSAKRSQPPVAFLYSLQTTAFHTASRFKSSFSRNALNTTKPVPPNPLFNPKLRPKPLKNWITSKAKDIDPREDEWAPENLGFLLVATITGTHGFKGELKARAEGDFDVLRLSIKRKAQPRYLLLPGRRYPRPVKILRARTASQHKVWILQLENPGNSEDIKRLRGARLYVRQSDRPHLKRGEFMIMDLVGSRVSLLANDDDNSCWYSTNTEKGVVRAGEPIGVVDSIITREDICTASGGGTASAAVASDILQVAIFDVSQQRLQDGVYLERPPEEAKRVLVPFVDQIVPIVDTFQAIVVMDPPEGLLDIAVVNRKQKRKPPRGLLTAAPSKNGDKSK